MPKLYPGYRDEIRKKIVSEAFTVFLAKGFEKTTMDDIAARLGVTKPAIYRYYKNKEELFLASHRRDDDGGVQENFCNFLCIGRPDNRCRSFFRCTPRDQSQIFGYREGYETVSFPGMRPSRKASQDFIRKDLSSCGIFLRSRNGKGRFTLISTITILSLSAALLRWA